MKTIKCPTCEMMFTEKEWNENTKEVVNSLNDTNDDIIKIENRFAGVLYRCPNQVCEDEVITNENLEISTITEELSEKYLENCENE